MSVKVAIVSKQKKIKLPTGVRLLIRKSCNAVLQLEGMEQNAEVDVTLVDDEAIKQINSQHRNIDSATDVLSFPLGQDGIYDKNPATDAIMLGDIVISVERAVAQSELFGHSLEREMAYLTVHSMLHLLGYDHVNGGLEKTVMREKEEEVLTALGLAVNKV